MDYPWLIYLVLFLAIVFFIWRLPIFVNIIYLKNGTENLLSVSILIFKRLKLYTFKISPSDFGEEVAQRDNAANKSFSEQKDNLNSLESLTNLDVNCLRQLIKSLYFEKLCFKLIYGFEDAALTAWSNGALYVLQGVFLALFNTYFKIKEVPVISFRPIYERDFLEMELDCIFKIRVGNVISIVFSMLGRV
jgi:hypothetical protein